jgi:DNA repair exonuclease SbcCD ATPase subunit
MLTTNNSDKSVKILFHLADIHIPNDIDRYDEYTKVFEKVYKIIDEERKDKMIIISGDLFNDKTGMTSYTLKFGSNFVAKLSKYCDVILIDGNHDVNMHNNKNEIKKTSTIEGMLEMINELNLNNNIHYLKDNKIYNINGINFGLTTMFSEKVTEIKNKKDNEIYIGLYHGSLNGSKTDIGYEITNNNGKYCAKDFKEYDLTLLGDIHKHQFLNKERTIAYPSSLIQQNYGENIRNHGLIKWDLENKKGDFIEINNEYCFLNAKIIGKELILEEDIELSNYKHIRAKIEYGKENITKILSIEEKLKKRFNIKELITYEEIKKYEDEKEILSDEEDTNIIETFEKYIKLITSKEEEYKELNKIILNIIQEKDLLKVKEQKNIKLNNISWDNLFCYGSDNIIEFDSLSKINGIIAENGWGKSSIIDILLYIIYQKCGRTKGVKVLNKLKKNGNASLSFSVNDNLYKINRSITPRNNKGEFREDLTVYKNGELVNESYKKDTMQMIENIFGSYDELTDNNILLQNGRNFIDKTDHEKKIIMYKIFGIDVYNEIYETINNKIDNLKKDITFAKKNLFNIETEKDLNKKFLELKNELNKNEEELKQINNILINQNYAEKKLEELLKNKNINYDTTTNKILKNKNIIEKIKNDIVDKLNIFNLTFSNYDENKIIKIINNLQILKDEQKDKIRSKEFEIKEITEIENIKEIIDKKNINEKLLLNYNKIIDNFTDYDDIDKLNEEILELKEQHNEYESSIRFLNELEEENKFLIMHKFNEKCIECRHNKKIHQQINYIEKIEKIKKQISKNNIKEFLLNKEIKLKENLNIIDIKNKKERIESENINYNNLIKINEKNIKILENNKKVKKELDLLNNEFDKINNELKINNENYIYIKKQMNEYNVLENQLIKLNEEKEIYEKNFIEIEKNKEIIVDKEINENIIKKIQQKIKSIEKEFITIQNKLDFNKEIIEKINLIIIEKEKYEKVIKIFTEEKLIEKILKKVIFNVESIVNNILKDITNFTLKFEINSDGIIINKHFKNEYIDARFLSGYEKFASNIALRIAFGKLNKYIKNDFIIIDEGFSSCDHKNINKINIIFDVIKKYYKWCITISHIDKIKNNFDKTFYINKINNTHNDSQIKIIKQI